MINRRSFLGSAFAASAFPGAAIARDVDLTRFTDYATGRPFQTDKPSLVAVFMTAQRMYISCGELFLYGRAEVDEIRGGRRNIETVMVMPPIENQLHSSERDNIGSAQASGFKILTADLDTTISLSRQMAGRRVFALEDSKITGHSQKAFFYNINDGRSFEFDPAENPFQNDLLQGLSNI